MSISDKMLASGNAVHIEVFHGEPILILDGPDSGKYFTAVRENQQDRELITDIGNDPRPNRTVRFRDVPIMPIIKPQTRIKTEDGKIWSANENPGDGYLSTDYKFTQIIPGKDT